MLLSLIYYFLAPLS